MNKYIQFILAIMVFSVLGNVSSASAQRTDPEVITPLPGECCQDMLKGVGVEHTVYLFTEKSLGKAVPLQVDADGVMLYSFSSGSVELLDEKKRIIKGKTDIETMGWGFSSVEEYYEDGERKVRIIPYGMYLLPVRKDKTYYIRFPEEAFTEGEEGCRMYVYMFPKPAEDIKQIAATEYSPGSEVYLSEGKGKYVYYPFTIQKKSLVALDADPMFLGGGDRVYCKVQKKIKGKWKDIVSVRSKRASGGQLGIMAPYGLSKGRYRLGIKAQKGQITRFALVRTAAGAKNPTKKSRAAVLDKGKEKDGVFMWEDKKAHWYKVVKSRKNRVKKLQMKVSAATDKINYTIYKKGISKPVKKVGIRGRERPLQFIEYKSKTYVLKDNGTYYIKVGKANKKTNGAYKIGVK